MAVKHNERERMVKMVKISLEKAMEMKTSEWLFGLTAADTTTNEAAQSASECASLAERLESKMGDVVEEEEAVVVVQNEVGAVELVYVKEMGKEREKAKAKEREGDGELTEMQLSEMSDMKMTVNELLECQCCLEWKNSAKSESPSATPATMQMTT